MTWHGLLMEFSSSLVAWIMLLGYTMLRLVWRVMIASGVVRVLTLTGQTVRQIAEHNHFVQGVAWDPLNEFIATQSSDRSVHIYTLKTKDGQFSLDQHNKVTKMDLPGRRISSNSPAPPDFGNHRASFVQSITSEAAGSP